MKTQNLARAIIYTTLLVWPGIHTYRLYAAKQDLAARLQLETKVQQRLAMTRQKTEVAKGPAQKL